MAEECHYGGAPGDQESPAVVEKQLQFAHVELLATIGRTRDYRKASDHM
jgi:hypothetical protein